MLARDDFGRIDVLLLVKQALTGLDVCSLRAAQAIAFKASDAPGSRGQRAPCEEAYERALFSVLSASILLMPSYTIVPQSNAGSARPGIVIAYEPPTGGQERWIVDIVAHERESKRVHGKQAASSILGRVQRCQDYAEVCAAACHAAQAVLVVSNLAGADAVSPAVRDNGSVAVVELRHDTAWTTVWVDSHLVLSANAVAAPAV